MSRVERTMVRLITRGWSGTQIEFDCACKSVSLGQEQLQGRESTAGKESGARGRARKNSLPNIYCSYSPSYMQYQILGRRSVFSTRHPLWSRGGGGSRWVGRAGRHVETASHLRAHGMAYVGTSRAVVGCHVHDVKGPLWQMCQSCTVPCFAAERGLV